MMQFGVKVLGSVLMTLSGDTGHRDVTAKDRKWSASSHAHLAMVSWARWRQEVGPGLAIM